MGIGFKVLENYKLWGILLILSKYIFETYLDIRQHKKTILRKVIPEVLKSIKELNINEEEFSKNRIYNLDKQRFELFKSLFNTIVLLILIYVNYFAIVWETIHNHCRFTPLSLIVYLIVESVRAIVLETPFSYYFNFVIEERHNFNKMT